MKYKFDFVCTALSWMFFLSAPFHIFHIVYTSLLHLPPLPFSKNNIQLQIRGPKISTNQTTCSPTHPRIKQVQLPVVLEHLWGIWKVFCGCGELLSFFGDSDSFLLNSRIILYVCWSWKGIKVGKKTRIALNSPFFDEVNDYSVEWNMFLNQ